MRLLSVLVLATMLGCSTTMKTPGTSRIPVACGRVLPEPSAGEEVLMFVLSTLAIGGEVAAVYTAIGGENPFR
ncbi:MAG TPA: hypothetical protein VIV11_25510 [Kofleriaceae bacterium]